MNNVSTLFTLSVLILFCTTLDAQRNIIYPGDVSKNGLVTGIDMLYWAYAFGAEGPERPEATDDWSAQRAGRAWDRKFPDGTNFAYADVDGSGRVEGRDLDGIFNNAGRERNNPTPDPYSNLSNPDKSAATLQLLPAGVRQTASGTEVLLDVELRAIGGGAFDRFHGLSFVADLPEGAFATTSAYKEGEDQLLRWLTIDGATGRMALTLTAIDHQNRSTRGAIARISLPLAPGIDINFLAGRPLKIRGILVHDQAMEVVPAGFVDNLIVTSIDCSFTIAPVTGTNGVTYLNSCFAEADGVNSYTPGAAWNPGLDFKKIASDTACGELYEPVCGFNLVTYGNACEAGRSGVINYQTGICPDNDFECYDPNLIVISNGTSLNRSTGIISYNCPATGESVRGCDGQLYPNACAAEAAGVRSYTPTGDDDCLEDENEDDAENDQEDCDNEVDFVCGCNDVTYVNACYAESAGVESYTPGPCNGTSSWCAEAVSIGCGDYLSNETTIGAGNQLVSYPGCGGGEQRGPDRVYTFQKTTAGDLQIGLEISTPGLNMDIFLLTGDCNDFRCVGASTTSNQRSNNEGIILEDAPNGTYYIVVDQPEVGPGGEYGIEISCGYLDCSEEETLTCGIPFTGTNADGNDDVSAYTCDDRINVENNGPETLHSFTMTEAGTARISLSGLSADLELFLLDECDRGRCLDYSQNSGTRDELILRPLAAGTYYVVVDGYNGAISDYELTIDCPASCDLSTTVLEQRGSNCGSNDGRFHFRVSGGQPSYTAIISGPVQRTAVSDNGNIRVADLPPGDYKTEVIDALGCKISLEFTLETIDAGLSGSVTSEDAGCGTLGAINITIDDGNQGPYTIYLSGGANETFTGNTGNFRLENLEAGTYEVRVQDANGCSLSETVIIENAGGDLTFIPEGIDASCDTGRGQIIVNETNGSLPIQIRLRGPVSGRAEVDRYPFRINRLLPGAYDLTLTDALGCTATQRVIVGSDATDIVVETVAANCSAPGTAKVTINGGTTPYTLQYRGPVSGTLETEDTEVEIDNLPAGAYTFSVRSENGCEATETTGVEDEGGEIKLIATQLSAACGNGASPIRIGVEGGTPNYTIVYTGASNGTVSVDGTGSTTIDLPPGTYSLTVTDFGGCSAVAELSVEVGLGDGEITTEIFAGGCGRDNNFRTELQGGTPPYQIEVSSACPERDTSFALFSRSFELKNLPNCTYTISVADANGCQSSDEIIVDAPTTTGNLALTAVDGSCGGLGRIDLRVTAGEDPYFIEWTGPLTGSINLASREYSLVDAPAGTYTFLLTNQEGCRDEQSITLNNDGSLELNTTLIVDDCEQPLRIDATVVGGSGPYTAEAIRLCDNQSVSISVSGEDFSIGNLTPCDYRLQLTDDDGCTTTTTLSVPAWQLFAASATDAVCGSSGTVRVQVLNSAATAPFTIAYDGPEQGSFTDQDRSAEINNLPAGNYDITVTGDNGCTETRTATIGSLGSSLSLSATLFTDNCGRENQLWAGIDGGSPPFTVRVVGTCGPAPYDTSFQTSELGFGLEDLSVCLYQIEVADANGCTASGEITVTDEIPELFDIVATDGPCGQDGRIELFFNSGTPPYRVEYTGAASGDEAVNGDRYSPPTAPTGDYSFTVTDAEGCSETEEVTVRSTTNNLELDLTLSANNCGQENQIAIDLTNGTAPFNVRVVRACDKTTLMDFVTGERGLELTDLGPCKYEISITDAAGCTVQEDQTITAPEDAELYEFASTSGACDGAGLFRLTVIGGTPPYTLEYQGPQSDALTLNSSSYEVDDLPDGNYTVLLTDDLGCTQSESFTVSNGTSDLSLTTDLAANDCGQLNQLVGNISGGLPPFNVEIYRLCNNVVDTSFTTFVRDFALPDAKPCEYRVTVSDAKGCGQEQRQRVRATAADLFDLSVNSSCDSSGFRVDFTGGRPPYELTVSGPTLITIPSVDTSLFIFASPGDYSVRAVSAEGCSERVFSSIAGGQTGAPPTVSFAPFVNGREVSFTNRSSSGQLKWTFGDGSESTERSPVHTYEQEGRYEVCLEVTNGCGTNADCRTIEVFEAGEAQLVLGGAAGSTGDAVSIPVSIEGLPNLASVAGTIKLAATSMARLTHTSPGAIDPQFNPLTGSFSFNSGDGSGVELGSGSTVLFYLHLELGGTVGSTEVLLVNEPVNLEVSTVQNGIPLLTRVTFTSGTVEIMENALSNISSRAWTFSGTNITDASFLLSEPGGNYVSDLPQDDDGVARTITGLGQNRMYFLDPIKDGDWAEGLSAYEIFLGRRYLLGYEVAEFDSPYQLVATDMNCSNSFSTLDLYLMESLLVGDLEAVPNCRSWTFVHESQVFPSQYNIADIFPYQHRAEIVLTGDTMTTFTGIKRGDLLGDVREGRSAGSLPIDLEQPERIEAGDRFELVLSLPESASLASLQAQFRLADGLELMGIRAGSLTEARVHDLGGRARLSWYSRSGEAEAFAAGTQLLTLELRATDALPPEPLSIEERRFVAEAFTGAGRRLVPELRNISRGPTVDKPILYPIVPNPAAEVAVVAFELPSAGKVELQLFDAFGRLVATERSLFASGHGKLSLDLRALPAGTYLYRTSTENERHTGRLVVSR